MQCAYCAYNSAATNAPGPFLVKHLKDEHGMDVHAAIQEMRRIKAGQPSEVAALRARVAELEGAVSSLLDVAGWYTSFYNDVQATTPEYFDLCGDPNAAAYLSSEAESIKERVRTALGVS